MTSEPAPAILPRVAANSSPSQQRASGFTLVEMLVVVGIIALIVAAMAPMVFGSLAASRLTAAGEVMAAQISFARQRAASANEEIEVRFYSYDDPEAAGTQINVNAMGIYKTTLEATGGITEPKPIPISEMYYLPTGVVVSVSQTMSRLLSRARSETDTERHILKAPATFRAFRFLPDGSTNILQVLNAEEGETQFYAQSYISLVEDRFADSSEVPKNFFAIQIDPSTGRVTTYRP